MRFQIESGTTVASYEKKPTIPHRRKPEDSVGSGMGLINQLFPRYSNHSRGCLRRLLKSLSERPHMHSDALSQVLRAIRLSGGMFFRARFRAPYAVTPMDSDALLQMFAPQADHMMPFHIVTSGSIWFEVPSGRGVWAFEDDVVVFPKGTDHSMTDEPGSLAPVLVTDLTDEVSGNPPLLDHGGDGEVAEALCGFFHCRSRLFNPLMDSLPDVLVVRRDSERTPWLAATIRRAFTESMSERPGSEVLVQRLAESLFVEVVQRHLESDEVAGWLSGLTDPVVGAALSKMHAEPARRWSLSELSRSVGVSRAALSQRFSDRIGISPIRYLTAWRMELAAQQLAESDLSIAELAAQVGYTSEASFGKAFKRHVGEPPASWRRSKQPGAAG